MKVTKESEKPMKKEIFVIKFEVVNGKKVGKSFSFDMDPKEMAKYKSKDSVRKAIEREVAKSGIFKRDELKELKYSMKEFLEEWKEQVEIAKQEEQAKLDAPKNNPGSRITPDDIKRLGASEVFVFGSNEQGLHYDGAAKDALDRFGAIMGQGKGLQGKSYAIVSMSGLDVMEEQIKEFCEFAKAHPEKRFLVTKIGCGIAGHTEREVAHLFEICREVDNITLPVSFWNIIGGPKEYDLDRFLTAQESNKYNYDYALKEIRAGRKSGHWMWYIFPQPKGLGYTANSKLYGLEGLDEARAYLAHPILGARLREICEALLTHKGKRNIDTIMGTSRRNSIDAWKLHTCMNLFNRISPDDIFQKVLDAFF